MSQQVKKSAKVDCVSSSFAEFEHVGWQRVADKYEQAWGGLTRSFIAPLLAAVNIRNGVRLLDVACGPGYVAAAAEAAGAEPVGVDFSSKMIRLAREQNPTIHFQEGDAHALPFRDDSFDVVTISFGLLHMSEPEKAVAESARVLKPGGRIGFTIWGEPRVSRGAKIVEDAINQFANHHVDVPEGPEYFPYSQPKTCQAALTKAGFDHGSFLFETVVSDWIVPTPTFVFESELHAGVRTAGLLARQTTETLHQISQHIADAVHAYETEEGYAIPFAAHVISARKKSFKHST